MITTQLSVKRASTDGHYWAPARSVSQRELRTHLRSFAVPIMKEASLGGDPEQGFEQSFSALAYSYIKDKSSRLMDFVVGFQLIDRNDDATKSVGVFGFNVGGMWLYVPIFFLNGDLKGHELMYVLKKDMFLPLKEEWVNHIISKKPHVLGSPSERNTYQLGGRLPDLSRFGLSPGRKSAAATRVVGFDEPSLQGWVHPFMPVLASAKLASLSGGPEHDRLFAKSAGLDACFDLEAVLDDPAMFPSLLWMAKQAETYPAIQAGFDRFYGPDFFARVGQRLQTMQKEAESYILPPRRKKSRPMRRYSGQRRVEMPGADVLTPLSRDPEQPVLRRKSAADILVYEDVTITQNLPDLTDEEREKLMRDTVLIRDDRPDDEASIAYNTQIEMQLMNPDETGLFELLEKPGEFSDVLIVKHPSGPSGREDYSVVIRKDSPRKWLNVHATNLWVRSGGERAKYMEFVEKLPKLDTEDLATGGTYILLSQRGDATSVFTVRDKYEDAHYDVSWDDHCGYKWQRVQTAPTTAEVSRDPYLADNRAWNTSLRINSRIGTGIRVLRGEVIVPGEFHVLKLKDPPKLRQQDENDIVGMCCMLGASESEDTALPIRPGNLLDVQMSLLEKAAHLKVIDYGSEVWMYSRLGQERMSKKAAVISLVRDHGLREKQARAVLLEAEAQGRRSRSASFHVKYAFGYGDLQPGPSSPPLPEQEFGSETGLRTDFRTTYPQEEEVPVDDLSAANNDLSVYDPYYQPDQGLTMQAQEASAAGNKQLFDTSMFMGMLKSTGKAKLVDRFIGDLMRAVDRYGRILFVFYWHQEDFEDRYGKQNLPELEDSIRNAFDINGDVVLYLMEKTVQGDPGYANSGVGNPDGSDNPEIEEAARN